MQVTEAFKQAIDAHLQSVAATDPLFAETLKKPAKNQADCITYILNTVKAIGKNGFLDAEVYNMAIHYYDEDNIDIGPQVKGNVAVKQVPELKNNASNSFPAIKHIKKASNKNIPHNQSSLF